MEMTSYFQGLLRRIEPDAKYVSSAKAAHETLRKQLQTDEDVGQAHMDTFLSGSYRRETAINEIKDVDVICVLDLDTGFTEPEVPLWWLYEVLTRYYD